MINILFFLRNRGSEKYKAKEMSISEVRKYYKLLTPVNSVIDQLCHYVAGTAHKYKKSFGTSLCCVKILVATGGKTLNALKCQLHTKYGLEKIK